MGRPLGGLKSLQKVIPELRRGSPGPGAPDMLNPGLAASGSETWDGFFCPSDPQAPHIEMQMDMATSLGPGEISHGVQRAWHSVGSR